MQPPRLIIWLMDAVLIITAIVLQNYSADYYGHGGCDGGLCALYFLFHTLPLLLAWVCQILAFNRAFKAKTGTLFFLATGVFFNTVTYFLTEGQIELVAPCYVLYALAIVTAGIYYYMRRATKAVAHQHRNNS